MTRLAKNIGWAVLCMVAAVARADSLSEDLSRDYEKRVLGVRNPIQSGTQEFDSNGNPTNAPASQGWEIYGGVLIEKVRLKNDRLRIEGLRVAPSDRVEKGKPVIVRLGKAIFEIHLDHRLTSIDEARAVIGRVFYLDDKDSEHRKPEFRRVGGSTPNPLTFQEARSGFVAPKPRYTPEPEFSETARHAKFQGTELMTIVIENDGTVSSVRIDRGLGYGLDQNAAYAVRNWRFTPAMLNGQPVSMRFSVEVDFHLY